MHHSEKRLAACRTGSLSGIFLETHRAKSQPPDILLKSALRAEKKPKTMFFLCEAEFQQHVLKGGLIFSGDSSCFKFSLHSKSDMLGAGKDLRSGPGRHPANARDAERKQFQLTDPIPADRSAAGYLRPKTASHPLVSVYAGSVIPDFDTCYRALAARDPRFDGLFFCRRPNDWHLLPLDLPGPKTAASVLPLLCQRGCRGTGGVSTLPALPPRGRPRQIDGSFPRGSHFPQVAKPGAARRFRRGIGCADGFQQRQMRRLLQKTFDSLRSKFCRPSACFSPRNYSRKRICPCSTWR